MAISFTNMVAPSGAASAVMNIRFLQKQGVEIGAATSSGVLAGLSGTMAQFGLLLVSAVIVGEEIRLGDIGGSGDDDGRLILLVVFLAAIAIGCVFVIPRLRRTVREKVWPQVVGAIRNIWGILTTPRQLALVLGGSIVRSCCTHSASAAASACTVAACRSSSSCSSTRPRRSWPA